MTIERKLSRASLAAAFLAMAAGCATSIDGQSGPSASAPKMMPGPTTVTQCAATTDPAAKSEICYVEVSPTPARSVCGDAQVTVNPDEITVSNSSGGRKRLRIRFQFKDETAGYRFCPALGEGLFLKYPAKVKHKQFWRAYGTDGDGEDNNPPSAEKDQDGCYKRFRVEFQNKVDNDAPPNSTYDYVLHFSKRGADDTVLAFCRKDPWVKNGQ